MPLVYYGPAIRRVAFPLDGRRYRTPKSARQTTSNSTALARGTTRLNTFDYLGKNLRTLTIDGDLWFVAADVCRILGLAVNKRNGSIQSHTRRLDGDQKSLAVLASSTPAKRSRFVIVSESGLYRLIMRSDKPEAREFQNWVTREVLPSIRKTGGYLLNEAARETAHADQREAMPLLAVFRRNPWSVD